MLNNPMVIYTFVRKYGTLKNSILHQHCPLTKITSWRLYTMFLSHIAHPNWPNVILSWIRYLKYIYIMYNYIYIQYIIILSYPISMFFFPLGSLLRWVLMFDFVDFTSQKSSPSQKGGWKRCFENMSSYPRICHRICSPFFKLPMTSYDHMIGGIFTSTIHQVTLW